MALNLLKVGDYVRTQFGTSEVDALTLTHEQWGKGERWTERETGIERAEGADVPAIAWELLQAGWAVVMLTNGHWCYGDQVFSILTAEEVAAETAEESR